MLSYSLQSGPLAEDPLVKAALLARPELDVAEAAMLSGRAWRKAFCSPGCRCAEERSSAESLEDDVARLGLAQSDGPKGGLRRSRGPAGRRRLRDLDLILELAVWSLRPPVSDWCETRRSCVEVEFGSGIYHLWVRQSPRPDMRRSPRAEQWLEGIRLAAAWLLARAGRQRTPYALRLRRAGEGYSQEADHFRSTSAGEVSDDVNLALRSSTHATRSLLESALMSAGISANVRALLEEPPAEELSGTALQEVVYLARAGRRPIRVLAARRLAGAASAQATATLGQLLWDPYAPLADTALWALGAERHEGYGAQARAALATARGMAQDDPAAIRTPLLCAATEASDELDPLLLVLNEPEVFEVLRPEVRRMVQVIRGM
jgi:hypothetical protein